MSGTSVGAAAGEAAVLTVLFTDIVGSTALTERLGDEQWVEVLSAHDEAVRRALILHAGREVKTMGDGFMVVFTRAASAVSAAFELQRLVAAVPVPGVSRGLRIRVGVHAGSVICRNGDVLGRNVNIARRIASEARGGQILVSSTVKMLAEQEGGLRSGPPRTLRLRGVSEPQVVFAMGAEDGATVHLLGHRRRLRPALPAGSAG